MDDRPFPRAAGRRVPGRRMGDANGALAVKDGADPEKAAGPQGRWPDRPAARRREAVEHKSQARVQCNARVYKGDPSGRPDRAARRGARGDARIQELPGEEEVEAEILVGVVRRAHRRPFLDRVDGRLKLAKDPSEQARRFIDASLRGRHAKPSKAAYARAIRLARAAIEELHLVARRARQSPSR